VLVLHIEFLNIFGRVFVHVERVLEHGVFAKGSLTNLLVVKIEIGNCLVLQRQVSQHTLTELVL